MPTSIELIFCCVESPEITKFKLPCQTVIQNIESNEYRFTDLDESNIFKHNREKAVYSIKLYSDEIDFEFKFHIYKGHNTVYIGRNFFFNSVYELIIFGDGQYNISQLGQTFTKFDSLGSKKRKRLTLINIYQNLIFDKTNIDLNSMIFYNFIEKENNDNEHNFYQISVQFDNNDQKFYIVKEIQEINDELYLKNLKDNKQCFQDFMHDLELTINSQTFYMSINNLKNKYINIFKMKFLEFNKDSDYITNLYKENKLNDINPFFIYYFIALILNNAKIFNNETLIKAIFKRTKKEMETIDSNKNITLDEKIKILPTLFLILKDIETVDDLNALNIKYIVISERKDNSIMDKVCKFYDYFIDGLSEDSKIFFNILELISGTGYYHRKKVFTFDLSNIDMVKKYLKSLFPKTLTIYNRFNTKNGGRSFYTELPGHIALNEIILASQKYYKLDYNSNNTNIPENDSNKIAMNIVLYIFQELGHKKFSSPKKIVRNNRLIKLKYENEIKKNDKNCEYILAKGAKKGDSGHYLELCFNKFNNKNIFKLLISLEDKGKLIKRPDLFVDKLETLENYVVLKTIVSEENIQFQFSDEVSIEDEISQMKKKIDIKKYLKEKNEEEYEKKGKNQSNLPEKKEYTSEIVGEKKEKYNEKNDKGKENDEEEEDDDEGEEEEEDEEEEEEEETEEEKKFKRILQKYGIENDEDEDMPIIARKILDERDLPSEDYNFLYDLYMKSIIKY